MPNKKKKVHKIILFVLLFLGGTCFLERLPKLLAISDGNSSGMIVEAAAPNSESAHTRKKLVASVVIGRLGYVLYDDGTATVVDEAGALTGLRIEAVDIIIPPEISYKGKNYTVTSDHDWKKVFL